MTTKTPLLLAQLVLVTTVLGCATEHTVSPLTANEIALVQRESVRQVSLFPGSSTMILDPGDNIKISSMDRSRYLCSNDKPLVCDRIGGTAYCYCPGVWQRR